MSFTQEGGQPSFKVFYHTVSVTGCYEDDRFRNNVYCNNNPSGNHKSIKMAYVQYCDYECDPECSFTRVANSTVRRNLEEISFNIDPDNPNRAYPTDPNWRAIWDLLDEKADMVNGRRMMDGVFDSPTHNPTGLMNDVLARLIQVLPWQYTSCFDPSVSSTCKTCDVDIELATAAGSTAITNQTVDRNNRPSVDSRVALKVFFMNDGEYIDPVEILDVTIFDRSSMQNPSTILGSNGLLNGEVASGLAKAYFKSPISPGWQDISEYVPGELGSSGVYRVRQGEYLVVLDGITNIPGLHPTWGNVINNTASATGDYIDVWTVRYPSASLPKVVINSFSLFNDTFFNLTEPLLIKTHNELTTKKVVLGSKQDLKITTEFTVENKNINSSIRNLFKTAVAINPKIKIEKINQDPNLPSRTTIVDFTDEQDIRVTSQNTFIYNWDTEQLRYHASIAAGTISGLRGIYVVTLKYDLLNETIVAPQMYVQLV
jgi:hypothetical protein